MLKPTKRNPKCGEVWVSVSGDILLIGHKSKFDPKNTIYVEAQLHDHSIANHWCYSSKGEYCGVESEHDAYAFLSKL